jgi:hypothetical protein
MIVSYIYLKICYAKKAFYILILSLVYVTYQFRYYESLIKLMKFDFSVI